MVAREGTEGSMAKYMILYRAPVSAREQMASGSSEDRDQMMEQWMVWAGKAGETLVDFGTPLAEASGAGTPVPAPGHMIAGYSILQADSEAEVSKIIESHPHLAMGGTIEVLEMLPMPGM
jgi:hypothetical protein